MKKFRNKYRIQSARMPNWDYGRNAAYFVTICTANRECYFGDIPDGEMKLSGIGEMANKFLLQIPQRYEYATLDEFIVMPNHVHAIVIIEKPYDGRGNYNDGFGDVDGGGRDAINRVSTDENPPENPPEISTGKPDENSTGNSMGETPQKRGGITGNKNPMLHDNISRIFNWYKGRVSFESRKIHADFA